MQQSAEFNGGIKARRALRTLLCKANASYCSALLFLRSDCKLVLQRGALQQWDANQTAKRHARISQGSRSNSFYPTMRKLMQK